MDEADWPFSPREKVPRQRRMRGSLAQLKLAPHPSLSLRSGSTFSPREKGHRTQHAAMIGITPLPAHFFFGQTFFLLPSFFASPSS